ncbi:MAG: ribbon-helix-helix protein, CopG family [Thermodesulfobacteriota bacterium]
MRTIVDIPKNKIDELDEIGKKDNLSRAALIREAVSEYLAKKSGEDTEKAFGIWKGRNIDALKYQENLRSEWEE